MEINGSDAIDSNLKCIKYHRFWYLISLNIYHDFAIICCAVFVVYFNEYIIIHKLSSAHLVIVHLV